MKDPDMTRTRNGTENSLHRSTFFYIGFFVHKVILKNNDEKYKKQLSFLVA